MSILLTTVSTQGHIFITKIICTLIFFFFCKKKDWKCTWYNSLCWLGYSNINCRYLLTVGYGIRVLAGLYPAVDQVVVHLLLHLLAQTLRRHPHLPRNTNLHLFLFKPNMSAYLLVFTVCCSFFQPTEAQIIKSL